MTKTILRIQYIKFVVRVYPSVFVWLLIARVWRQGYIHLPQLYMEGICSFAVVLALCVIFSHKIFRVTLTESILQAPVRKGIVLKSMVIDLSEIIISRRFMDWICGSQVVTRNGDVVRVKQLCYTRRQTINLLKEIEIRKGLIAKKSTAEEVILK